MPVKLRVLFLEDRPEDAELLLLTLRRAGYDCIWKRVENRVDYLASLDDELDLILADYDLPQFNALQALRLLQEREQDIPFIVVTGSIEEVAIECMKEGAADYLLKDRLGRLAPAIEHVLQEKRLRDEKKRAEEAIRAIQKGTADVGEAFFQSFVLELARILQTRYAFVGQLLSDDHTRVRTVALCEDGSIVENIEYDLNATPCQIVMESSFGVYPSDVQQLFPNDCLLHELNAESYMGISLRSASGISLGLIVVLHDKPIFETDLAKTLLTIFAARASAELERLQAELALYQQKEAEQRFSRKLSALYEASLKLAMAISQDDLCRLAIELGRESLEFDRIRIWFLDLENHDYAYGSFGTDEQGKLSDERSQRLKIDENILRFIADGKGLLLSHEDTPLRNYQGDIIGYGDHLQAALWDGKRVIGIMSADNLFSGRQITQQDAELSVLFAQLLGHLSTRKQAEESLRESEARFRLLAENASDLISRHSPEGHYLYVSPACQTLLGYMPEDLLGLCVYDFIHPEDTNAVVNSHSVVLAHSVMPAVTYRLRRKDGQYVWVESLARAIFGPQEGTILEIQVASRDITRRKKAEDELRDSEARLRSVVTNVPIVLFAIDQTGHFTFSDGKGLDLLGLRPGELVGQSAFDVYADYPEILDGLRCALAGRSFVRTIEIGTTSFESWYSPLYDDNEAVIGVIGVATDVTERIKAERELQLAHQDLAEAYDVTIKGWSRAMDYRDHETEGHTERVADMTLQLARAMEISDDELIHIQRGALLHDMGKMAIPDAILQKPGPLTDDEWVIMRKHPEYGFDMLSHIEYLRPALDIPLYHHEKWDGTGYPHQLKGNEIPLAARIFAVVDVWDALAYDRIYRSAWPREKILSFIRSESGKHFDPHIVDVFLKLFGDSDN